MRWPNGPHFKIDRAGGVRCGMAVTIFVGHLALQVFTMHVDLEHEDKDIPDVQPKVGDWENMFNFI
jgi:hypothetical protein